MASSLNDPLVPPLCLDSLSLDLPDVVVEAQKVEKPKRGRGRRCLRRNLEKKHQPQQEVEDVQVVELGAGVAVGGEGGSGASALPASSLVSEDKRIPDLTVVAEDAGVSIAEKSTTSEKYTSGVIPSQNPAIQVENECATTTETTSSKKTGTRSKKNRKRGKRKPGGEVVGSVKSSASQDNKENHSNVNEDVAGDWRADDSDDEEPKYIWRNVTKNGDIKKCILVDGKMDSGRPKPGDTVLVKVQGKLKDGTIVDDYPTMVFIIGEYEVIDGLDLVVQSMYRNELSIVSIKPDMAYGEQGRGTRAPCGRVEENVIPGNARITYLFGLLHFEKAKDISTLTWAQRRKTGQNRLRLANWWYQRKEYPIAVKCYRKALTYYNDIPTNRECSSAEEYKELLQLMEERLRVMRQVANIFRRISNLIQCGQIAV